MNNVSLFLYAAQVSSSLGALFIFLGIVVGFCVLTSYAAPRVFHSMEGDKEVVHHPVRVGWLSAAICFLVIGNLMPERNTMYAIAASQVGEQILKSEAVTGVVDDGAQFLRQWIKQQMATERSGK